MTHKTYYYRNDNLIELSGLQDVVTDSFINESSSVFLTIQTLVGSTQIESGPDPWPAAMTYVASSDGVYRVTVDRLLNVEVGSKYLAVIDASGGLNLQSQFVSELFVSHRQDA